MEGEDPLVQQCRGRVGEMINGKYRLDALIGVGGMAAVYMATHRNGSIAAIKLLHDEVARNEEVRSRFLREAYIANKVGHEGTVKVLDDDTDEHGTPFLVMELLQGQSVEALADSHGGSLGVEQTLDIIDQTLAVLEAAHAADIVHRDLKPENLFMTGKTVKVLDFGIARLREDNARKTQTGMVMGTPSFMAPEQAMGRWSDVDARTDLYAVGATAFSLLSGRSVHEAETAGEMLVAAATRPARSLSRVVQNAPLSLVALVDKALSYERTQRFPDATAFRRELARVRAELAGQQLDGDDGPATHERPIPAVVPIGFDAGSAQDLVDYDDRDELVDSFDPSEHTEDEIRSLEEVFTLFERALVATKQYSQDHPETKRRFTETFRELASALMNCDICLSWNLTPYGFVVQDRLVWEPEVPWNRIPYQLFSDGVRTMGFVPGLDEEEFHQWVDVVTLDPTEDLSPEDDMVTELWDAEFTHAFHQAIDSFAEGNQDQRARYERDRKDLIDRAKRGDNRTLATAWRDAQKNSPEPQGHAAESSARVLTFLSRGEQLDQATAARVRNLNRVDPTDVEHADAIAALEMDGTTRALLAARLETDVGATSERFVFCAAQAFVVAARAGRSTTVSTPLRRAVDGLGRDDSGRAMQMVLSLRDAIEVDSRAQDGDALRGQLITETLSTETLFAILQGSLSVPDEAAHAYVVNLKSILTCLQDQHFDSIITFLPDAPAGEMRDVLLEYLQRVGRGRETELARMFESADVDLGLSLVRILAGIGSDKAREAITLASRSPHPLVRIEALGHVEGASGLRVKQELRNLLGDTDDAVRLAALQAMERHEIAAAGPFLVVRMQEKSFLKLPLEERRQCLKTLRVLKVQRCEEVCITLLSESSWLRSEALESTRELAAHFLGEVATTNDAFYALERVAMGRDIRNSKTVKGAAQQALARISERAEKAEAARKARAKRRTRNTMQKGRSGAGRAPGSTTAGGEPRTGLRKKPPPTAMPEEKS